MKHSPARWRTATIVLLLLLAAHCVLWEGWLAPLRAGGSWLTLKALPLLIALPGLWRGRRYTYQWFSMLELLYVAEGAVRIFDPPPTGALAAIELLLACALFLCVLGFARSTRPSLAAKQTAAEEITPPPS